ncbi:MAG: Hsp20/alpha crystallin family protein [Bacteroidetes bacterium]|nr:Hsp20/alpha crystallin family protein [Bacteroidota bacterium]
MTLIKWNPTSDLFNLEREFNRLFSTFGDKFGISRAEENAYESAVWSPLADISEDDDKYEVKLDLPGIDKKDVKLSFTDGQITISGEKKQENKEKNTKYHKVERMFGKYYRSFVLPVKIKEDKIDAQFKNGQLTITIPKADEVKPKEIEIKVS